MSNTIMTASEAKKMSSSVDKLQESRAYVNCVIHDTAEAGETTYTFDKFNRCFKDLRALETELVELGYEVEFYTIGDRDEIYCSVSWDGLDEE